MDPTEFTEKIIRERVNNFYNHNAGKSKNKSKNDIKRYIVAPYNVRLTYLDYQTD